jgi:hypothetical protein
MECQGRLNKPQWAWYEKDPFLLKDCGSDFHLVWWNTWSEIFFEPIQTILVLDVLIFRPEKLEKNSIVSNAAKSDLGEPSRASEVSSAYCDILCSVFFYIYTFNIFILFN